MLVIDEPIFCDNHLLVLDKPHGLLTQPSGTDGDSLEAAGKAWVKAAFHKPGAVFLEAVHRIDRVVGGLVLFARTSKALSRLNEAMRQSAVKKTYLACVQGVVMDDEGVLVDWLLHGDGVAVAVPEGTPEARRCELRYRVLERREGTSLLEIDLKTGRYHQIRAQLSRAGWPIVGDVKYGGTPTDAPSDGIALLSCRLAFAHPVTHQPLSFQTRMKI